MLMVATVVWIRREHAGGKAIKAIARDLRLSRKLTRRGLRRFSWWSRTPMRASRQRYQGAVRHLAEMPGTIMRNVLVHAAKSGRRVASAFIATGLAGSIIQGCT